MPVSGDDRPPLPARERMLRAAVRLISTQGVTRTGLREIVAASDAPRGSLQHYFPGGKDQLVTEAITIAGEVAARRVLRLADHLPSRDAGTHVGHHRRHEDVAGAFTRREGTSLPLQRY
ncbi:MAG: hypothetical protein QOH87_3727, partial [Trebonia sp.]|nr:hypothetical protein [Trebonia sp.]